MNTEELDTILEKIRTLAVRLVADNDDGPEEAAEQGCELARL